MLARSFSPLALAGALTLCLAACADTPPAGDTRADRASPRPAVSQPDRPRIVFLGDSLTAGLGLDSAASYPSLIERRLEEQQLDFEVVNAGVSGDTSAGGLRRVDWALDGHPRIVVVALGANDGLRGLPTAELQKNLAAIIERVQARDVKVVLAGMEAPPNNGPEYAARFRAVYTDLARKYDIPLVPFLLDGVAGDPAFNQADGIHPNVEGARRVADTVWLVLEPVLAEEMRKSR